MAKHRSFKIEKFVTGVSSDLLRTYFTRKNVPVADGFVFDRQVGDHRAYVKPGISRPVIIPTYKEIDVDIITSNLRTAGMTRDRYFKLLKNCK